MTTKVSGDPLPVMKQEATDLHQLAEVVKISGRLELAATIHLAAEGYEGACDMIARLRESPVEWYHEDTIPDMPNDLFRAARKASRVIGGVRMYPYVRIDGVRHMAVIHGDVSDDFKENSHVS